ncbi:phosphate butyryltransferase [Prevotella sp. E9-3]|uniref:phosphate acyltransferase n=1 Tax=Prevotella sp. E9-3 TaxID=2913621 RepID=UPI001EDBDBDA|nr:phosphate acyltransferase [Prevotella sp. E9-3]UKK48530.1 phosphate butyryltransferase [Prevotella sp. E9-3]
MDTIQNLDEMIGRLIAKGGKKRIGVICPRDESTRKAVEEATSATGFAEAVVFDNDDVLVAAQQAVAAAREGKVDVLMKGALNTDDLLRAVLNKETGILPKGRVLTHLTCAQIPSYDKLVFCSDVAVIPYPTAEQREEQLKYLLQLMRSMGVEEPRVGLINCTEKVNEKHFPVTVEYRQLVEKAATGVFGPCIVDGPLDLKTCFSPEALHKKGINSPLEGRADAIIFPDIQAGNVFYKTITCFIPGVETAAVLAGTQVPVVLPSRGDSPKNKLYSLALACSLSGTEL